MTDHYYHFIRTNGDGKPYLGYSDNRIVTVGETITVGGTPVLCQHGLHASKRILDALEYCPVWDVALCRVELGGTIIRDTDKSVASERTIIAMLGAERTTTLLRDFARWCALQVADLWDTPQVVRQYLETGDETLRASARNAAAARAAWAASARDASAWAAWAAAEAADAAAARSASWAAVWAAARSASIDAARSAQEEKLVQLFEEAGGGKQ